LIFYSLQVLLLEGHTCWGDFAYRTVYSYDHAI